MRLLSRSEELVLLTVWKLKDDASCLPIREHLTSMTGKNWSLGSIFDPLDRLERKGHLRSTMTEPANFRGGRSKRIYRITSYGKRVLAEMSEIQAAMWADVSGLKTEGEKA